MSIPNQLLLCTVMLLAGCENDKQNTLCYQGEVISLNSENGCDNIIEILKIYDNSDSLLTIGSTITFDPDLYGDAIKLGDIVYFKILEYMKNDYNRYSTLPCTLYPQFGASIEFCHN